MKKLHKIALLAAFVLSALAAGIGPESNCRIRAAMTTNFDRAAIVELCQP